MTPLLTRATTSNVAPSTTCFGLLVLTLTISSGCASMQIPAFSLPGTGVLGSLGGEDDSKRFQPIGSGAGLASETLSESVYHKVRQAKVENGIVLQIIGDEAPIRVLPLPPASLNGGPEGAPSVFVSTLLRQTGVQKKLGNVEASLFRPSPGMLNGVRMDVKFSDGEIRPETDYALRPGDRLVVKKAERFSFQKLVDMSLAR